MNSASDIHQQPGKLGAVPEIRLRDYQETLSAAVASRYASGHASVLAYLPTGGGKTHVAAAEVALELRRGGRALVVVNSRTLLEQTRRAFLRLGFADEMIGLVGAGELPCWPRPVQVSLMLRTAKLLTVSRT